MSRDNAAGMSVRAGAAKQSSPVTHKVPVFFLSVPRPFNLSSIISSTL